MEVQDDLFSIRHVPLLNEAISVDDDWTHVKDPKARRKVQNRLNQRTVRRRKDPEKSTPLRSRIDDVRRGHQSFRHMPALPLAPPRTPEPPTVPNLTLIVHSNHHLIPTSEALGDSKENTEVFLPLSSDHLISLVAHNVYRALLTNMLLLGTPNVFTCSLATANLRLITALPLPSSVPPALFPTALQRSTQHPPWIDVFPIPETRDVLIQGLGLFDEHELCQDTLPAFALAKDMFHGHTRCSKHKKNSEDEEQKGLIIWGDPWDPASWEITPFFLMKWGWMFRDCYEEVIRNTNHWRSVRAEEPLSWESSLWSHPSSEGIFEVG